MGSVMQSFVDSSHRRLAVRLVLARVWCSTACAAIAGRDGVLKPPRSVVGGMDSVVLGRCAMECANAVDSVVPKQSYLCVLI